jgi:hypothetical protein
LLAIDVAALFQDFQQRCASSRSPLDDGPFQPDVVQEASLFGQQAHKQITAGDGGAHVDVVPAAISPYQPAWKTASAAVTSCAGRRF